MRGVIKVFSLSIFLLVITAIVGTHQPLTDCKQPSKNIKGWNNKGAIDLPIKIIS